MVYSLASMECNETESNTFLLPSLFQSILNSGGDHTLDLSSNATQKATLLQWILHIDYETRYMLSAPSSEIKHLLGSGSVKSVQDDVGWPYLSI